MLEEHNCLKANSLLSCSKVEVLADFKAHALRIDPSPSFKKCDTICKLCKCILKEHICLASTTKHVP